MIDIYVCMCVCFYTIVYTYSLHRYKEVDKQMTHAMHVNVNDTFIDKLTKWYQ